MKMVENKLVGMVEFPCRGWNSEHEPVLLFEEAVPVVIIGYENIGTSVKCGYREIEKNGERLCRINSHGGIISVGECPY